MKVKVKVYDGWPPLTEHVPEAKILFEGMLELVNSEYATVIWPEGSKDYHVLWTKDKYLEWIKTKDIDPNEEYWFYWDD